MTQEREDEMKRSILSLLLTVTILAGCGAVAFAEAYNAAGGDCTVVNLPDEGITGNSHFMFQEMNNDVIAAHIENWLGEHGLN